MKMLYLKGYKWFLLQNQPLRDGLFSYRWQEALVKNINDFVKINKVKGCQYPDYQHHSQSQRKVNILTSNISAHEYNPN